MRTRISWNSTRPGKKCIISLGLVFPCRHFILQNNSEIQELPEGVFEVLSFQNIYLSNTALKAIHPLAILSSRGQLENLTVENSRLGRFPFHVLSMLPRLKGLWLKNNSFTSVPAIQSENLEILYLSNNAIQRIKEYGWTTPNLKVIDLGEYAPFGTV